MKRLLPVLVGFVVLLLSSTEAWSLPPCPGSPTSNYIESETWTDPFGTATDAIGDKYVGEWNNAIRRLQRRYSSLSNGTAV